MNEKMRVIVITLFLIIVATIAEEINISKVINPAKEVDLDKVVNHAGDSNSSEREANIGKTINLPLDDNQPQAYESPKFKSFVTHCSSHVVDTCSSGITLHQESGINRPYGLALCLYDSMEKCLVNHGALLDHQDPQLDQIPTPRHIPPRPIPIPIPIPIPNPTAPPSPPTKPNTFPFTFKDNHDQDPKFDQIRPIPVLPLKTPNAIQYQSTIIETLKFQTVLRTCTHVSAQSCYTSSDVAESVLARCLIPSLNQCIYPDATKPGNLPTRA